MTLPTVAVIVNAILLVLALILAVIILRAGSIHFFNYGITEIQDRMKWRILRAILALIVVALVAILFNLIIVSTSRALG